MIRRPVLAGLVPLALCVAGPAFAADTRLVTHPYNENEVVRVEGRLGVQATIAFGDGELIENVAVGDAGSWQITPNKRADVLFIKPLAASARTNMTVLTDKRTYFFDLVAAPAARAVYLLRFAYADAKPAKGAASAGPAPLSEAESAVLSGDPQAAPVDPAALNFAWRKAGAAQLLPLRIYDDGVATYLQLAERQTAPAILMRNEKGEEGPVNFAVRGDTLVIDGVPPVLVLRSGKASATLHNLRPQAAATAVAMAASTREKK